MLLPLLGCLPQGQQLGAEQVWQGCTGMCPLRCATAADASCCAELRVTHFHAAKAVTSTPAQALACALALLNLGRCIWAIQAFRQSGWIMNPESSASGVAFSLLC